MAMPMQRIWVYCEQRDAAEDVLGFCKQSKRLRLIPELVKLPKEAPWRSALKALIARPPAPYDANDWRGFWSDVDALLVASLANKSAHGDAESCATVTDRPEGFERLQGMRWPSLLVTDREKMCKVMFDITVRGALAEAVSLRVSQLVPVVLAADFGSLCGLIVTDTPMVVCDPLTLRPTPGESSSSSAFQHRRTALNHSKSQPLLGRNSSANTTRVELRLGVFLQRSRGVRGNSPRSRSAADGSRAALRASFGARVVALLADGRCAYAAISADGTRGVEASGVWEVVNGHLVIGGRSGQASVSHVQYVGPNIHRLEDVAYEQPIHISLLELTEEFEPPIRLADCVPSAADRVRLTLGAKSFDADGRSRAESIGSAQGLADDPYAAFRRTQGSPLPRSGETSSRSDPEAVRPATAEHALMSLANNCVSGGQQPLPARLEAGPQLLGLQRGISEGALDDMLQIPPVKCYPHQRQRKSESSSDAMQRLLAYVSTLPQFESQEARVFATCPVRPGVYSFETGRREFLTYQTLSITLNANGSCKYMETARGSVLKSVGRGAFWRVEGNAIILDSRELGSSYSFVLRAERGTRTVQRQVAKVMLPVSLLERCQYQCFLQQHDPFPKHAPLDVPELVFGLVDPSSPVMHELKCRPDRVPYHAFEQELRRRGLSCDDIISDFLFIDRDRDGQLSAADMRMLEDYGNPVASPEMMDDLRIALVRRYGSLAAAFVSLVAVGGESKVTPQQFEDFLLQAVEDPSPDQQHQKSDGGELLREWMQVTTPEDRAAVYTSLNPHKGPAIEQTDFMSLNLYSAVLAVRRLEHFRSWILEEFGGSNEAFEQVFKSIDLEKKNGVNMKIFVEGVKALGYPCCEPRTMHSVFSLLDRGFGGKVSLRDFQRLNDFKAETLLKSLDGLKRWVEDHFGGVDECYQKLVQREQQAQGLGYVPKCVSFGTIHKLVTQAGVGKNGSQDGDPRMLFLFLSQASQERTTGNLGANEWSLLKGFSSRALTGCPARLRRILLERYGGMDQAFQQMHNTWLSQALVQGLLQTALAGLARALCGQTVAEGALSSCSESPGETRPQSGRSGSGHFPSVARRGGPSVPQAGGLPAASPSASERRLPALSGSCRARPGGEFARSASCAALDVGA